jgi:hypothetical protein
MKNNIIYKKRTKYDKGCSNCNHKQVSITAYPCSKCDTGYGKWEGTIKLSPEDQEAILLKSLIEQLTFEVAELQKTVRLQNQKMTTLQDWADTEITLIKARHSGLYRATKQQRQYQQWGRCSQGTSIAPVEFELKDGNVIPQKKGGSV